jgi:CRP-like cAMP-binding protein
VEGNFKIVELLLQEGVDKNVRNRWGQTVLQEAMAAKQGPVVELLLQWKIFINAEQAGSALCTAASTQDVDQLRRLIDNKADINAGDYDSRSALHIAAADGHGKVVEFLLEQKADPNKKDRWACTPLLEAVRCGRAGLASLIRSKGGAMPEEVGAVQLCAAASKGDLPSMRTLHECGIRSDAGDYDARCPLHLAAAEARILAVSFLLGVSSNPNCMDRWGSTPLDDAFRGGTLYHKYCARLIYGWGGQFGALRNSQRAIAFLDEVREISMEDVRSLIRRLIDAGYDKRVPQSLSEQQIRFSYEASARHMGLVRSLQDCLSEATAAVRRQGAQLSAMTDHILATLRPVCAGIDAHPARRRKESRFRALNMGARSPVIGAVTSVTTAGTLDGELQLLLARGRTAHAAASAESADIESAATTVGGDDGSDGDDAGGLDSDEEAQLHAELDAWVQMQERMEAFGGNQHRYLASVFLRVGLAINGIEEMFRTLVAVFRTAGRNNAKPALNAGEGSVPTVGRGALATALELLAVTTSDCDIDEMFEDALFLNPVSAASVTTIGNLAGPDADNPSEGGRVAFTAVVAASEVFRQRIMSLDTDEVFCDLSSSRAMRRVPESRLRSLARHGRKRNVAKGEKFCGHSPDKGTASHDVSTLSGIKASSGQLRREPWYVLLSGAMIVEEDPKHLEERRYNELGPGDIFGGFETLSGNASPFALRVTRGGLILELEWEGLKTLRTEDPALAQELSTAMGEAPRSRHISTDTPKDQSVIEETDLTTNHHGGNSVHGVEEGGIEGGLSEIRLHAIKQAFSVMENMWREISVGDSEVRTSQLLSIEAYVGEVGSELFRKLFAGHELPETLNKTSYWDIWMSFLTKEVRS